MDIASLMRRVADLPVFTSSYLLAGQPSPAGLRRRLDRWVKAGKVLMLRRGVYTLAAPYGHVRPHPFLAANALRRGSYVSMQSALAFYGLIPEYTEEPDGVPRFREQFHPRGRLTG